MQSIIIIILSVIILILTILLILSYSKQKRSSISKPQKTIKSQKSIKPQKILNTKKNIIPSSQIIVPTPSTENPILQEDDDNVVSPQIVAVITAAIMSQMEDEQNEIRIHKIKRKTIPQPIWNKTGIKENMNII